MKWEYKSLVFGRGITEPEFVDLLNQQGAMGWELVDISWGNIGVAYFKRRLS